MSHGRRVGVLVEDREVLGCIPSTSAANSGSPITAPVPFSCAPVMIVPEPSPFSFTYAPEGTANDGHQPHATPIASSSGSSWP